MFEYTITYYDVAYFIETKDTASGGNLPLADTALPVDPNPESLYRNPLYLADIERLANAGWELITVTPLLRGCYNEGAHYGYSLTAGYFVYWKRVKAAL